MKLNCVFELTHMVKCSAKRVRTFQKFNALLYRAASYIVFPHSSENIVVMHLIPVSELLQKKTVIDINHINR